MCHRLIANPLTLLGAFALAFALSCGGDDDGHEWEVDALDPTAVMASAVERRNEDSPVLARARQLLVVASPARSASSVRIDAYDRSGEDWVPAMPTIDGSIAAEGFAPRAAKREGDRRSPTGLFPIESAFGIAERGDALTRLPWRAITPRSHWVVSAASPDYNEWVERDEAPAATHLALHRRDHTFDHGIVIGYNRDPIVRRPARGSAIFLHSERFPGKPTSGGIAVSQESMLRLLRWLDPDADPVIAMGTAHDLHTDRLDDSS